MLVLALDTSSLSLSCALVEAEASGPARALAESLHEPPEKASDLLPEALARLCAQAGRSLADVSALAVGLGPGSFTGLRIGLATAKALAYARRWPLAGASSLHALALGAAHLARQDQLVLATAEARRGELYAAPFRRAPGGGALPAGPIEVHSAAQFAARLRGGGAPLVLGPGASACAELLAAEGVDLEELTHPQAPRTPQARAVAELCLGELSSARFDPAALFALAPDYRKPSEAEVALSQGRVGGLTPPGGLGQGGPPEGGRR